MANKIVEYKMHRINTQKNYVTPYFIDDGGYFPDGNKIIGLVLDSSPVFVPVTSKEDEGAQLIEYTRAELIARQKTLGMTDTEGNEMSDQEIEDVVNAWCDERSIPE